jgi:hypothetical protein
MFKHIRRWLDAYKKFLLESYELPKPTVYKLGTKRYIKVKKLRTGSKTKGPYLK